ncbi:MAG: NAD-dependent epimerase/dehydratase family protein [Planctomycetia bacterium]|nr:NAD-dependent epimerase/dehydratase family protein [Planctomycetia bacterium]
MVKRVLVTGVTGFIGTVLTEKLLQQGYLVRGMGRRSEPVLPPGGVTTAEKTWQHPNFEYHQGDVTDLESVRRGVAGCHAVIHLAAYANNWCQEKRVFEWINIDGTRNVLRAVKEHPVEKVVCTSSIVTLGPTPKGVVGDESMPRQSERCFTDYERTKLQSEREILEWVEKEQIPAVIVNPTRVYGPGQLSESNSVVVVMDMYERGIFPFLVNFGKNLGNYVLVEDVAQGLILAMEQGRVGERYILGSEENITLRDLYEYVDTFRGRQGFKFPLWKFWPMVVAYTLWGFAEVTGVYPPITPGWVKTFTTDGAFSCGKAQRELGYRPTPVREGLRKTYDWIQILRKKG